MNKALHPMIKNIRWETAPEVVFAERAKEILATRSPMGEFTMTPGEREGVKLVWKKLEGNPSMYDALVSISNGEWE